MSILTELDAQKADLQAQFPGWQIWYVPKLDKTVTWCARPRPHLVADSTEQLAADIAAAQPGVPQVSASQASG